VPSICTTVCGLAGTLAREGAAIVANPTDDALYGAIRRLLTDRPGRARLSARAAATAASAFSMTAVAEVLEEEYGTRDLRAARTGRQSMLWITDRIEISHLGVWDALRSGTDLTVAFLDDGRVGRDGGVPESELTGRGHPVVRIHAGTAGAPRMLRAMIRDRPDVVIVDGDRRGLLEPVTRWARRAGVHVVRSMPEAGPGATAARASLLTGRTHSVDLDLRSQPQGGSVRLNELLGGNGNDVIDLKSRTRSPGPRHA
jgi:hypothetical protein